MGGRVARWDVRTPGDATEAILVASLYGFLAIHSMDWDWQLRGGLLAGPTWRPPAPRWRYPDESPTTRQLSFLLPFPLTPPSVGDDRPPRPRWRSAGLPGGLLWEARRDGGQV